MAPTEILPGLWIGDQNDSQSYLFIKEKNIHIIINCTPDIPFLVGEHNLEKKRISLQDSPQDNQKMYQNLEYLTYFIYRTLNKNQNIFIHSVKCEQRAPTIVAAYFIRYGKVNANQAIKYIQSKSPQTFRPFPTFDYSLHQFAKDMTK